MRRTIYMLKESKDYEILSLAEEIKKYKLANNDKVIKKKRRYQR